MDANGREPLRETVGFVGLGRMGWPMAANLARAGYRLIVRDADSDVERRFAEQIGAEAATEASAFADAGVVITMLPDGRAVQDAVIADGIADVLWSRAVVIDMSSSSPQDTRELGRQLDQRSVALVDAPVSGGSPVPPTGAWRSWREPTTKRRSIACCRSWRCWAGGSSGLGRSHRATR